MSEGHHYWTIQSLAFTLQEDNRTVRRLDKFRQKRNISDYEMSGTVTEKEATEMLALARSLHQNVEAWLKKNHPELVGE
ncbi:MAG: hypothetical protein U1D67_05905 [Dehalococcoidia bacterium]|nr:hypothetical protein [Dehalococcoidia bacterium]